ncbi:endonuclease domain-containing protein [Rhizorhapis suberifaciens]|uniref:endonuclease domain-containing protein n=1 Tax=Rhizorhapis suberifaciens TaxID=13656 RepID=UPI001622D2CB|nr:endonuclease domain-containing protein [Rhizorhapis suberifaciens]
MAGKPLTDLSRTLRQNSTDAEIRLWHHLRAGRLEGYKFRRQAPVGRHIADFLCSSARLIVELDGSQHAERSAEDQARTRSLQASGYTVLRFWNNDVLQNTHGVLEEILHILRAASGGGRQLSSPLGEDMETWP